MSSLAKPHYSFLHCGNSLLQVIVSHVIFGGGVLQLNLWEHQAIKSRMIFQFLVLWLLLHIILCFFSTSVRKAQ